MSVVTSPETGGESKALVHIVLADRGWILERCAYEISSRFDYVSVGDKPDPTALINYYVNYHAFQGKQPGIDIGFFTHIEPTEANTFFDTAKQLDASVCMSSIYADELEKAGIKNIYLITPGVDLDIFKPVVRIGVVGRTYKSGRKGERLVQSVMDEPGIEWHFTGEGWPGQSIMYPAEEMPNFYNNIDYLLIPSSYEGGPMSLLEALACGREVIAPPIGFVSQFPHIEYKTGDSEDLRLVLKELVKQRTQLRESVLEKSWSTWAFYHDILFRDILKKNGLKLPPEKKKNNILLAMGAVELNSRGGPTVRIEQYKEQLHQLGFKADISTDEEPEIRAYDLVHVFNIWPPESTLKKLKYLRTQNVPMLFSPIFLDLSELLWANEVIPTIFQPGRSAKEIDADISKTLSDDYLIEKRAKYNNSEFFPGYYAQIKDMIASVDYIIGLSDHEIEALKRIAGEIKPNSIVRNAIDTTPFQNANPTEFYEKFHIRDYVLCVGRIEPRKNQLMLIYALRNTAIPIVLIGQETDERYGRLVHSFAGENVYFIGEIPHDSTLLASAFAGAKVFCLPSWSEGAPIAALEAAACGIPMILSNRSGEIEYFGSAADYCEPMDPSDIRKLILNVFDSALWKKPERIKLQQKLQTEQTVTNFAEETLATYDLASLEFEKNILQQIDYSSKSKSITHASPIQTDHTPLQEKLVEVQVELSRVQAELNNAVLDRDRIWNELNATIHSKSHRIMNPIRKLARLFRRMPISIQNIKAKAKPTAFSVIHFIRMLPLFSYMADAVKKTFPGLWARYRKKLLRVHNYSEEQLKQLSSAQLHEDEQYFLHLFRDEIARRKHSSKRKS